MTVKDRIINVERIVILKALGYVATGLLVLSGVVVKYAWSQIEKADAKAEAAQVGVYESKQSIAVLSQMASANTEDHREIKGMLRVLIGKGRK